MSVDLNIWIGEASELEQWKDAPLGLLTAYIVEVYHREGRIEMARLETQVEEAALLEGRDCPELLKLRDEVEQFCTELRAHFKVEERSVFPAILDLAEGRTTSVSQTLLDPVRLLKEEHHSAAGLLDRIHSLTAGFNPPGDARGGQRRLFQSFQILADSLCKHIYLENEILFKRLQMLSQG